MFGHVNRAMRTHVNRPHSLLRSNTHTQDVCSHECWICHSSIWRVRHVTTGREVSFDSEQLKKEGMRLSYDTWTSLTSVD